MNPLNNQQLIDIVQRDPRYAYEVYDFVFQGLEHTHRMLGREPPDESTNPNEPRHHVSVRQWLEGICDLARREFGLMAGVVFRMWGVRSTDDFGAIVFNLIDADLICRMADETRADFHDLFDLDEALQQGLTIGVEEE